MQVSLVNPAVEDSVVTIEVDLQTTIRTLKSLIEVELGVPVIRQQLTINGTKHNNNADNKTLNDYNVQQFDLIMVLDAPLPSNPTDNLSHADALDLAYEQHAENLINQSRQDLNILGRIRNHNPRLAEAITRGDLGSVVRGLRQTYQSLTNAALGRNMVPQQTLDPLDPETQRRIYERIQHEQVNQNLAQAQEYLPESFGTIFMLYIRIKINNVPIVAFVDSGAQATIMSQKCAQKCGLERLIDKRFKGSVTGVGQARANLVGRIHMAQMECGSTFFPCSFTIIENAVEDCLLGLDLLRRHQCCIDLKQDCLRIGDHTSVNFLPESEVRAHHIETGQGSNTPIDANTTPTEATIRPPSYGEAADLAPLGGDHPQPRQTDAALSPHFSPGAHTQVGAPINAGGRFIEEEKVRQLIQLGVDADKAREVLRECDGNVEVAAARIFTSL